MLHTATAVLNSSTNSEGGSTRHRRSSPLTHSLTGCLGSLIPPSASTPGWLVSTPTFSLPHLFPTYSPLPSPLIPHSLPHLLLTPFPTYSSLPSPLIPHSLPHSLPHLLLTPFPTLLPHSYPLPSTSFLTPFPTSIPHSIPHLFLTPFPTSIPHSIPHLFLTPFRILSTLLSYSFPTLLSSCPPSPLSSPPPFPLLPHFPGVIEEGLSRHWLS